MASSNDLASYRRLAYGARIFAVVVALVPTLADGRRSALLGVVALVAT
jgi:hypothetical protein